MMKCPVDGTELRIAERQGIEIDYCPQCRGVWLDRGELDKILEREAQYAAPQSTPPRSQAGYENDMPKRKNDGQYAPPVRVDDDYDERYDRRYEDRRYDDDYRPYDSRGKKKKSFLGELFDVFD